MGYLEMSLWSQMSKVTAIYLAVTVSYTHSQLLYHFLYAHLAHKHISLPAVPKVESGPSVQCTCWSLMAAVPRALPCHGQHPFTQHSSYWALVLLIMETAGHRNRLHLWTFYCSQNDTEELSFICLDDFIVLMVVSTSVFNFDLKLPLTIQVFSVFPCTSSHRYQCTPKKKKKKVNKSYKAKLIILGLMNLKWNEMV